MILVNSMMKMNYKKIVILFPVIILGLIIIKEALAFGSVNTLMDAREKARGFKEEAAGRVICLKIDDMIGKSEEKLNQKNNQLENQIQERINSLKKNREKRDENLFNFRLKADQWRERSYEKLENKAQTLEQKTAVEEFKKTVEEAIKVRREAIDEAIDTFRDGVDQAQTNHQTAISEIRNTYRHKVQMAFQKAKEDCDKGVNEQTVRANLRTNLALAKSELKEDKAGVLKFRDDMKNLIAAKKAAFEKAITDFKSSMQRAIAELKKAFPEGE